MRKSVLRFNFKILRSFAVLFAAVFAVLFAGFIMTYTNNFTTSFKTFYIEYGGEKLIGSVEGFSFDEPDVRIDCKYTFDFLPNEAPAGFDVSVVPNADFDFYVDGYLYSFAHIADLTAAFGVEKHEDEGYFTMSLGKSMPELLGALYPGAAIEIADAADSTVDYFLLIVSSYDGSAEVRVGFKYFIAVKSVVLDKSVLLF